MAAEGMTDRLGRRAGSPAFRAKRGRRPVVREARPEREAGPVLRAIACVATARLVPARTAIEALPTGALAAQPRCDGSELSPLTTAGI